MSCFDAATPGTGPLGFSHAPMPSLDFEKFNNSFNLSLRSKSDFNLNPQPEGSIKASFADLPENREGIYVPQTDRGELSPTIETQVNITGGQTFQSRLQDDIRPTMKETTLYTYSGTVAPVTKNQALYSQFIPEYTQVNGKSVRVGGASNYGLRAATEHSYFSGAAPTGISNTVMQNPDVVVNNLWKRPDFHVDGPGTFNDARPDGTRYQNYKVISKPTTSGLKLDRNLESENAKSLLTGNNINGIESRYTAAYQIAPLLTNPLHVIWNPDNKGDMPAYYCNTSPQDYSYANMTKLPQPEFEQGGYNQVWGVDPTKDSNNAYILGMENGNNNERIEWKQDLNDRIGVVYDPYTALPGKCYSGNRGIEEIYQNDRDALYRAYPHANGQTFTVNVNS